MSSLRVTVDGIWRSGTQKKMQNVNDVDNIATLNETLDGYNVSYIDDAKYDYDGQKHVARVSGLLCGS